MLRKDSSCRPPRRPTEEPRSRLMQAGKDEPWLPLARFIGRFPALVDFVWGFRIMPRPVLLDLHAAGPCRLHMHCFRLSSLVVPCTSHPQTISSNLQLTWEAYRAFSSQDTHPPTSYGTGMANCCSISLWRRPYLTTPTKVFETTMLTGNPLKTSHENISAKPLQTPPLMPPWRAPSSTSSLPTTAASSIYS